MFLANKNSNDDEDKKLQIYSGNVLIWPKAGGLLRIMASDMTQFWKWHQVQLMDLGSANGRRQALPDSTLLCIAND